jgi:hypothetical protein
MVFIVIKRMNSAKNTDMAYKGKAYSNMPVHYNLGFGDILFVNRVKQYRYNRLYFIFVP